HSPVLIHRGQPVARLGVPPRQLDPAREGFPGSRLADVGERFHSAATAKKVMRLNMAGLLHGSAGQETDGLAVFFVFGVGVDFDEATLSPSRARIAIVRGANQSQKYAIPVVIKHDCFDHIHAASDWVRAYWDARQMASPHAQ